MVMDGQEQDFVLARTPRGKFASHIAGRQESFFDAAAMVVTMTTCMTIEDLNWQDGGFAVVAVH